MLFWIDITDIFHLKYYNIFTDIIDTWYMFSYWYSDQYVPTFVFDQFYPALHLENFVDSFGDGTATSCISTH